MVDGYIPNSSVYTQMWNKVYDIINTNVTDPGGKSKWIYTAFPEKRIDDEGAYPLVVITPIDLTYDPLTFVDLKEGPLRVTIDVYSRSAEELDTIVEDIANAMDDSDAAFTMSGVTAISLTGSLYSQHSREKLRVHNRTLEYEFNYGWF